LPYYLKDYLPEKSHGTYTELVANLNPGEWPKDPKERKPEHEMGEWIRSYFGRNKPRGYIYATSMRTAGFGKKTDKMEQLALLPTKEQCDRMKDLEVPIRGGDPLQYFGPIAHTITFKLENGSSGVEELQNDFNFEPTFEERAPEETKMVKAVSSEHPNWHRALMLASIRRHIDAGRKGPFYVNPYSPRQPPYLHTTRWAAKKLGASIEKTETGAFKITLPERVKKGANTPTPRKRGLRKRR